MILIYAFAVIGVLAVIVIIMLGIVLTHKWDGDREYLTEADLFNKCHRDKLEDAGREGIWDIDRDNPLTK